MNVIRDVSFLAHAHYRGIARYWVEEMGEKFLFDFASLSQRPEERVSVRATWWIRSWAALWFLCDGYESCVLRVVNLGNGTATATAVAGGLASIH